MTKLTPEEVEKHNAKARVELAKKQVPMLSGEFLEEFVADALVGDKSRFGGTFTLSDKRVLAVYVAEIARRKLGVDANRFGIEFFDKPCSQVSQELEKFAQKDSPEFWGNFMNSIDPKTKEGRMQMNEFLKKRQNVYTEAHLSKNIASAHPEYIRDAEGNYVFENKDKFVVTMVDEHVNEAEASEVVFAVLHELAHVKQKLTGENDQSLAYALVGDAKKYARWWYASPNEIDADRFATAQMEYFESKVVEFKGSKGKKAFLKNSRSTRKTIAVHRLLHGIYGRFFDKWKIESDRLAADDDKNNEIFRKMSKRVNKLQEARQENKFVFDKESAKNAIYAIDEALAKDTLNDELASILPQIKEVLSFYVDIESGKDLPLSKEEKEELEAQIGDIMSFLKTEFGFGEQLERD